MIKYQLEFEIANQIRQNDINNCKKIGEYGCEIIKKIYNEINRPVNILTHCNAGWLATVDWGTALLQFLLLTKIIFLFMYGLMKRDKKSRF